MKYSKLENTSLNISKICLGTMTFGEQNTESEAHDQLDFAIAQGVNFIDTAEMYPIPRNSATQGMTEMYIGSWLEKRRIRSKVIIGTKVTGPAPNISYISDHLGFSASRISDALHKSMVRLKTDYIDLYQWHWPERATNCFGVRGYTKHDSLWKDNFEEGIGCMADLIKQGKIRYWGISNETPWGVMRMREICLSNNLPLPVTIQNPYNLLNRSFETGLSEICMRTNLKLLAYSPLAFGLLSGKYHLQKDTAKDRLNQFPILSRYNGPESWKAVSGYLELAEKFGISPVKLALAFVNSRPWMASNIIGASSIKQLEENISSIDFDLSDEMESAINELHQQIPDPAP